MPRRYRVPFDQVAVSAAQDLVTLLLPTSAANFKSLLVERYWVQCDDTTIPSQQQLALRLRLLGATVTPGSGGTTPTPQPLDLGDTASKCSAHVNDTSKSTTGGTATILDTQGCFLFNGFDSAQEGQDPIPIAMNTTSQVAVVFELLNAPSGTIHLSGGIDFVEAG